MFGNTNTCMIKWKSSRGACIPSQKKVSKFCLMYFVYVYTYEFKKNAHFLYTWYNMRINDIAQLSINYKMKWCHVKSCFSVLDSETEHICNTKYIIFSKCFYWNIQAIPIFFYQLTAYEFFFSSRKLFDFNFS